MEAAIFAPRCGGGGCHQSAPLGAGLDLLSAGVATRLGGVSMCMNKSQALFMLEKVKAAPACGSQMPLGAEPLSTAEVTCLQNYLRRVTDGGVP